VCVCNHLDEFQNNYTEWKNLDNKEYVPYDSIYTKL
jgi:hypothetical protein